MTAPTTVHPPRARDLEVARVMLAALPRVWGRVVRSSRASGLSFDRAKALFLLRRGPLRSGELAQHLYCAPSASTELVEALVEDGLVERSDDPRDRRAVVVALTAEGRRAMRRHEVASAEALAELVARLDSDEKEHVSRAFAALGRALEE